MLNVKYSTQFKRDMKTCAKRRCNMALLQSVIDTLRIPAELPPKNADHTLSGDYIGYRECHITPDWLLVYRHNAGELFLYRTGTHSDLF